LNQTSVTAKVFFNPKKHTTHPNRYFI